jgi:hypothetical protein
MSPEQARGTPWMPDVFPEAKGDINSLMFSPVEQ